MKFEDFNKAMFQFKESAFLLSEEGRKHVAKSNPKSDWNHDYLWLIQDSLNEARYLLEYIEHCCFQARDGFQAYNSDEGCFRVTTNADPLIEEVLSTVKALGEKLDKSEVWDEVIFKEEFEQYKE